MTRPYRIGVVPIGAVPDIAPKVVAAHITGHLNLETTILEPMCIPMAALDEQRLQFDAAAILHHMESRPFIRIDKIVGVLSVDIFLPIFTHVFGEARQGGRVALVSFSRLTEKPPEMEGLSSAALERTAKVALHELGHLFDLAHCENNPCLMHFSGNLEELDRTPFNLCRYCTRFFMDVVKYRR